MEINGGKENLQIQQHVAIQKTDRVLAVAGCPTALVVAHVEACQCTSGRISLIGFWIDDRSISSWLAVRPIVCSTTNWSICNFFTFLKGLHACLLYENNRYFCSVVPFIIYKNLRQPWLHVGCHECCRPPSGRQIPCQLLGRRYCNFFSINFHNFFIEILLFEKTKNCTPTSEVFSEFLPGIELLPVHYLHCRKHKKVQRVQIQKLHR